MSQHILEREISLLGPGCEMVGTFRVEGTARFHGKIRGSLVGAPDSKLIVCETGVVEGNVSGEEIWIDGYVRGDISAQTKIVIASSGRVIGNLQAPSINVEFGAHFDGKCSMVRPTSTSPS
jgi:cytoskeletal protein CcmA (bactofilin family)